jgi:hypothetical protein
MSLRYFTFFEVSRQAFTLISWEKSNHGESKIILTPGDFVIKDTP